MLKDEPLLGGGESVAKLAAKLLVRVAYERGNRTVTGQRVPGHESGRGEQSLDHRYRDSLKTRIGEVGSQHALQVMDHPAFAHETPHPFASAVAESAVRDCEDYGVVAA